MATSKSLLGRGGLEFVTCNQVTHVSLNNYHVRKGDDFASLGSLLSLLLLCHPTENFVDV